MAKHVLLGVYLTFIKYSREHRFCRNKYIIYITYAAIDVFIFMFLLQCIQRFGKCKFVIYCKKKVIVVCFDFG